MHSFWIALALCAASPQIDDGSLLFLENCNSVVEYSTGGEIGHVALAFQESGETYVYEATPGKVRRVTFAAYQEELARINRGRSRDPVKLLIAKPGRPFSPAEVTAMQEFLDEQLGRRYSVKNYVKSKPGDGTHCAELAANTLNRSGRFNLDESYTIHPARLATIVEPEFPQRVEFAIGQPAVIEPWYVRWGRCCSESCNWCGWSCREAWSFVTVW
jgi:hypothetical protein